MNDNFMQWDLNLLRRFGSTSHFRLLNQVRSELRAQPLNRDINTKTLNLEVKPTQGINIREDKRNHYNQNNRNFETVDSVEESINRSFKDRLDAIDMR